MIGWFKKKTAPKETQTTRLFEPYPGSLVLPLVTQVLLDRLQGRGLHGTTPDLDSLPEAFDTPHGLFKYTDISDLRLVDVICVNETGMIIPAQIRAVYFEQIFRNLAQGLNLEMKDFFMTINKGERMIIAGAEKIDPPVLKYTTAEKALKSISRSCKKTELFYDTDTVLYSPTQVCNPLHTPNGEYYFSYFTTTTEPSTMFSMISLGITAKTCLENNSFKLPPGGGWEEGFLQPIISQIKTKLVEDRR